jgi:hypothetical protein
MFTCFAGTKVQILTPENSGMCCAAASAAREENFLELFFLNFFFQRCLLRGCTELLFSCILFFCPALLAARLHQLRERKIDTELLVKRKAAELMVLR